MSKRITSKSFGRITHEAVFRFFQLMRNRLAFGPFKYEAKNIEAEILDNNVTFRFLHHRLHMYDDTGNLEFLVDIANGALMEWARMGGEMSGMFNAHDSQGKELLGEI